MQKLCGIGQDWRPHSKISGIVDINPDSSPVSAKHPWRDGPFTMVKTMKIVVAIKQVPARDSLLRVNAGGTWIQDSDLNYEINEPDAYALEEGLQIKEKHGGEVIVLCAGPARAAQTIREALAKGADRALHIEEEDLSSADPLALARLMAKALESEKPDLILTGLQSDDFGYGQTGVILAELMGLPSATIIMSVEVNGTAIKVKRELENGWFQQVEMPLPALLTMQSGSNKLRYATLMGIKKAKSKEIKRLTAGELGGIAAAAIKLDRIYLPERSKKSQIFDGAPREAAAQLVEKLRFEARIL
jgi:electron transfer flavoprotein beta subunit